MIEAHGLVKRYGSTMAVDDLSFSIRPGMVTGFLGPNGAGKTTTMRMILGLDAPTQGSVTVDGQVVPDRRRSVGIDEDDGLAGASDPAAVQRAEVVGDLQLRGLVTGQVILRLALRGGQRLAGLLEAGYDHG